MATLSPRLVARGPVTSAFRRHRLIRDDVHDVTREILIWLAITWIPFAAIAGVEMALGAPPDPLFLDPRSHVRFAVALPLMVLGRRVIGLRCDAALVSLEAIGTAAPGDRPALDRAIRNLVRWCTSPRVETIALLISLASGAVAFAYDPHASGGFLWYALVCLPVFRYVLLLALFRWLAWSVFLLRVSYIRLALNAAHPDRAGGLGFLCNPTLGIAVVLGGMESIVVAHWYAGALQAGSLKQYVPLLLIIVGTALVLALGPLVPFAPQMVRARVRGIMVYGRLSMRYVRRFEAKHIAGGTGLGMSGDDPDLLGSSDIQSLADMGNSFSVVQQMRGVPFDKRTAILVMVTAATPALVLEAMVTPTMTILSRLARVVIGVP